MSYSEYQNKTSKQVKEIFQEVLQNHPPIVGSSFKKVHIERVKNHKKYADCIAVNLRWGEKANYDYICCHVEKSEIAFPHDLSLSKIGLNEFLFNKEDFLHSVAHMLSEPLHTNLNLRKNYAKTVKLLSDFQSKGILGENLVDSKILSRDYQMYYMATEYLIDGIRNSYSSSVHTSFETTFIKSVIEAIEWWSITWKKNNKSATKTFSEIKDAVNPSLFSIYGPESNNPSKKDPLLFDSTDSFHWTEVYEPNKKKQVGIPSQLVYSKYPLDKEKIIRIPISTGSAAHFNYKEALLNGLCELIERDNFSLYYLTQTSPKKINCKKDKKLNSLVENLQNNLDIEIAILDFSYEFPTYSIGVVFINRKKSLISIGLSCNFEIQAAIESAIFEAYKTYLNLHNPKNTPNIDFGDVATIFKKNKQFWIDKKPLQKIEFLFRGETVEINTYRLSSQLSTEKKIHLLSDQLKRNQYRMFVKRFNFHITSLHIVKVIVPNLIPLPLYIDIPYKKTLRIATFLQTVKKPYDPISIPPPFF